MIINRWKDKKRIYVMEYYILGKINVLNLYILIGINYEKITLSEKK